ncbi:MAG TPA: NAD(+) diphosphatase [Streptosporangiaceae bacterium]|nr:NAD(+) diphosphatase [Streptosporangiaceae bacterium]
MPRPSTIALTRSEVERSAPLRSDAEWLKAAWASPQTRVMLVADGQALIRTTDVGVELIFVSPQEAPDGVRFLLGVDAAGVAYFGVLAEPKLPADATGVKQAGLREAGHLLTDRDAGLLTNAVGLANWHAVAGFCPRCGAPTDVIMAGHARRCTNDGSEHFPRCDPAVIMLVADPDDRCLLARNVAWPERRVSVLAGFVETGESAEQAVAREVYEEVGITVTKVSYAGSQPWPMPHSLMLGFRAETAGTEIHVDAEEISEAAWYSRADLKQAIEAGDLLMPPSLSISRWLIETWYGGPLPRAPRP